MLVLHSGKGNKAKPPDSVPQSENVVAGCTTMKERQLETANLGSRYRIVVWGVSGSRYHCDFQNVSTFNLNVMP